MRVHFPFSLAFSSAHVATQRRKYFILWLNSRGRFYIDVSGRWSSLQKMAFEIILCQYPIIWRRNGKKLSKTSRWTRGIFEEWKYFLRWGWGSIFLFEMRYFCAFITPLGWLNNIRMKNRPFMPFFIGHRNIRSRFHKHFRGIQHDWRARIGSRRCVEDILYSKQKIEYHRAVFGRKYYHP